MSDNKKNETRKVNADGTVTFVGKDGKEYDRQPCEIWTRVLGYHRPVKYYNKGKKSEYYSRTYFKESKSLNQQFNEKYA